MKYRIARFYMSAFLIFSFLQVSCASTRLQRPVFSLSFPGNITTGFQWFYKDSDENAVELVDTKYAQNDSKSNSVGQPGYFTFSFRAKKKGYYVLNFDYYRPWDKKNIEKSESVKININDKYVITRV